MIPLLKSLPDDATEINIVDMPLSAVAQWALLYAIQKRRDTLQSIILNNVGLTAEGLKSLTPSLKTLTNLSNLDISHNPLKKLEEPVLSALMTLPRLTQLNLSATELPDESAVIISVILSQKPQLRSLKVSANLFHDESAIALLATLYINDNLIEFDLTGNPCRAAASAAANLLLSIKQTDSALPAEHPKRAAYLHQQLQQFLLSPLPAAIITHELKDYGILNAVPLDSDTMLMTCFGADSHSHEIVWDTKKRMILSDTCYPEKGKTPLEWIYSYSIALPDEQTAVVAATGVRIWQKQPDTWVSMQTLVEKKFVGKTVSYSDGQLVLSYPTDNPRVRDERQIETWQKGPDATWHIAHQELSKIAELYKISFALPDGSRIDNGMLYNRNSDGAWTGTLIKGLYAYGKTLSGDKDISSAPVLALSDSRVIFKMHISEVNSPESLVLWDIKLDQLIQVMVPLTPFHFTNELTSVLFIPLIKVSPSTICTAWLQEPERQTLTVQIWRIKPDMQLELVKQLSLDLKASLARQDATGKIYYSHLNVLHAYLTSDYELLITDDRGRPGKIIFNTIPELSVLTQLDIYALQNAVELLTPPPPREAVAHVFARLDSPATVSAAASRLATDELRVAIGFHH